MLDYLMEVENSILRPMLANLDGWNRKLVTYEKPTVERLWRQHGENRIYIHRIHPCKEGQAFMHRHPWPSAMRIYSGRYMMSVSDDVVGAFAGTRIVLGPECCYEMTWPECAHSVRPIGGPVLSLMVTGPLYNPDEEKKVPIPNPELELGLAEQLLFDFRAAFL